MVVPGRGEVHRGRFTNWFCCHCGFPFFAELSLSAVSSGNAILGQADVQDIHIAEPPLQLRRRKKKKKKKSRPPFWCPSPSPSPLLLQLPLPFPLLNPIPRHPWPSLSQWLNRKHALSPRVFVVPFVSFAHFISARYVPAPAPAGYPAPSGGSYPSPSAAVPHTTRTVLQVARQSDNASMFLQRAYPVFFYLYSVFIIHY